MKISIVSGGFDPIHSGHIAYLVSAANLGDQLWVCLNSDDWLIAKKGRPFMPFEERKAVLESMKVVDKVIDFDDSDGSCSKGLERISFENPGANLIFCNGGDRNSQNIPEKNVPGVEFVFGVGGNHKKNSSSKLLNIWTEQHEQRSWGDFIILHQERNVKVKELRVLPNHGMSFQRHQYRQELWFIHSGACKIILEKDGDNIQTSKVLEAGDYYKLALKEWHQITNPFKEVCKIIEIQYGAYVEEQDIERKFFFSDTP